MVTERHLDCGCVVGSTLTMCPEMVRLDAAYKASPVYPNGANARNHLVGGIAPIKVQFDDEDAPVFDGFTAGQTWNGWACPMFEKAEADRLIAYINAEAAFFGRRADDDPNPNFTYDPDLDAYIEHDVSYFEETKEHPFEFNGQKMPVGVTQVYPGNDFHGRRVYDIGAGSWCWNDVTFPEGEADDAE